MQQSASLTTIYVESIGHRKWGPQGVEAIPGWVGGGWGRDLRDGNMCSSDPDTGNSA